MNQKFIFSREEDNKIKFKELSELEPGLFQILYTEDYDEDQLSADMNADEIIVALRNNSFYPTDEAARIIADGLLIFLQSDEQSTEILFNDKDQITEAEGEEEEVPVDVDVDDLLNDDELESEDKGDDLADVKIKEVDDEK